MPTRQAVNLRKPVDITTRSGFQALHVTTDFNLAVGGLLGDASLDSASFRVVVVRVSWCALMKDVVVLVGDPSFVRCQPFSP